MSKFSEVARVSGGELTEVDDWMEVMNQVGSEKQASIVKASRHMWSWLNARAQREDETEFTPVHLTRDLFPKFTDDEAGIPGWRWEGSMTDVFITLWPSIADYIGGGRKVTDPLAVKGGYFRADIATQLKYTKNVVRTSPGNWFISAEWQVPEKTVWQLQYQARRQIKAAKQADKVSLKAAQARGAVRQTARQPVAPVKVSYNCREPECSETFATRALREAHETQHKDIAARTCRVCTTTLYANVNAKAQHERVFHPELAQLSDFPCPVPGCTLGFDAYRGLAQHLGMTGHDLPPAIRYMIADFRKAHGHLKGFRWPQEIMPLRVSTTTSNDARDAHEDVARSPEPTQAVAVPATATNQRPASMLQPVTFNDEPDQDQETLNAVAYLGKVMTRLDKLETENAELKAKLAQKDAIVATFKTLLGES